MPPPSDVVAGNAPVRSGARWGWRALVAFVAGGLIAAAGFGAARVGLSDEAETASAPTSAASPDPTPTPTTVPEIRGTAPAPLGEPPADIEPAAFVAQVLGPAVVKLETGIGLGSGVLYDENLVLTNFHVIEGATNLTVTLSTGRVLPAEIVGTDPSTDVAVVRVETDEALPLAELATGVKPQVGQLAVAIGSPFDLQQSVTQGIVSAVDRPIPNTETSVVAMIQTDAPINPGNSGGALADRFGRVIGINTSIQTDGFTSTNVGVGFAIPIDTAVRIADLLVAGLPIEPGFLGVRGEEPPNGEVGVLLTEITEDSAAESAGLQTGDRVLSLDGAPVSEMLELAGLVLANQAGDTVVLEVVRDGELIEIEAVLGEREADN
ncbi:MAG: trypsin-like peptidase domain-containing protein [Actinomycetota bacterium]